MRYILLFIFSFQSLYSQEYSIEGELIDAQENTPVTGATVYIPSLNKVSMSKNDGTFAFSNIKAGEYKLKVSCIGYNSIEKSIKIPGDDAGFSIILHPVVEDLETVVITGTRSEKKLKDDPILTQVIHPAKLQASGINSVGAALQHEIPGLEISQFNFRTKVSFQGMTARYILFLVDGERISGEMEGDIDYARLGLDYVDRIEVVRGASSALYGSNAIGGVINIITKKAQLPFELNVHSYMSDYNSMSSGMVMGIKKQKFSSRSSVSYNQSDRYDLTPPSDELVAQEKFKNASFNQRFDINISQKLDFIINGGLFYNRVFDAFVKPIDHGYAGINGYFKALYKPQDSLLFEITYAADDYLNYDIQIRNNDHHAKSAYDFQQCFRFLSKFNSNAGIFILGTEYKPEKILSDKIIDTTRFAHEEVLFFQHDYSIGPFGIVTGARGTFNSEFGFNFVPKLTLMAKTDPFTLRMSFGMGFRSPTLKEMYYSFDHFGMFTLYGNDQLKPEKSKYIGFSIEHNLQKSNISLYMYYNRVTDMIANNQFLPRVFRYENISSARIWGLDFLSRFVVNTHLNLSTGLSLNDTRNLQTKKRVYDVSPISVNGNINYAFRFLKNRANTEIFGRFTGQREYEPIGEITYKDASYSTWRFTYTQYYKTNFILALGVDNIFNNVDPGSLGNTSPGRRFFVSMNYTFTKY